MTGVCLNAGMGPISWAAAEQTAGAAPGNAKRFNVLHIISDDLRARLGCYGDPMVKTPNIDRLAARGVLFDRAYCQFPLCNPSRASFMTGLRPDTTKVYENKTQFREVVPDAVTIPQSFAKAGYSASRVGKIYHYGVPNQIGTSGLDDPASWETFFNPKGRDIDDVGMIEVLQLAADGAAKTETGKKLTDMGATLSWLAAEGPDSTQTDGIGATETVRLLEERAKSDKPFYLAVGFYRPHTPFVAPKAYFSKYVKDDIALPKIPPNLSDLFPAPPLANQKPAEVAMSDDLRKQAILAYSASTSFMDAQVGVVLDALERLHLADNTIVVFQSDHGYHLGEKNLWQKMSIFEESIRVPLIIAVPGNKANGQVSHRIVELVSLHKTLTDLCGIPAGPATQGYSMAPLVREPASAWDHAAYSQVTRGGGKRPQIMGRTVRTERWRYTEWDEGKAGVELYDHDADPLEMANLATDAAHAHTVTQLRDLLRKGGA